MLCEVLLTIFLANLALPIAANPLFVRFEPKSFTQGIQKESTVALFSPQEYCDVYINNTFAGYIVTYSLAIERFNKEKPVLHGITSLQDQGNWTAHCDYPNRGKIIENAIVNENTYGRPTAQVPASTELVATFLYNGRGSWQLLDKNVGDKLDRFIYIKSSQL